MNEINEFNNLHNDRLELSNAIKKNKADGIKKLLENLYPDNAHFIYELLQNAEDAQASQTAFILSPDELIFIHNGKRKFSLNDIESITNIEASTKADDSTTIGKFGVGFKSVFAYTDTPEIKSGDWHFYIKDLFVPELTKTGIEKEFDKEEYTFFRFPFNNPKKSPEKAFNEIQKGLENLPLETLLFLNNIKEISWTEKATNKLKRIERREKEHKVELVDKENNDIAGFLKFNSSEKEIETEDGKKQISVSLAYRLANNKIIPTDSRENVFIYFPAVKENSGLRFLINAPFAAPNSRDSVLHNEDNEKIIDLLVDLQTESLSYLKENDYLTVDFLNVLPNSDDDLDGFYEAFHSNLIEVFQNQDFTPTKSGEYRPSGQLYRSDSTDICDIITDDNLSSITNYRTPLWSANPSLKNSNADKFLDDLDIDEWGSDELIKFLADSSKRLLHREIFKDKDFKILRKLYPILSENNSSYDSIKLRGAPIFRTQNGLKCASDDVYFPEENEVNLPVVVNVLINDLFKGIQKEQRNRLKETLKRIGVKEFDDSARFQLFMKKFNEERKLNKTEIKNYIQDLKRILKNKEEVSDDFFTYFILDGDNILRRPMDIYIDYPYEKTDLEYLESISGKHPLSKIFINELSKSECSSLIDLIKDHIGFYTLKIEHLNSISQNPHSSEMYHFVKIGVTQRRSESERQDDYDIEYLNQILRNENLLKKVSHLIWECLLNAKKDELQACYTANRSDSWHYAPSYFVCSLQDHAWILGKDGNLHKPQDITIDDLPDDWERPISITAPLKAVHFGENKFHIGDDEAKKAGFENFSKMQKARWMLEQFEQSGKGVEDFKAFCFHTKKELPVSSSCNPERRAQKVIEEHENSVEKTYSVVSRTVRTTSSKVGSEAHEYLSNEYANDDNEMFCQICQTEMPFKKRDNSPYFEAIEIFTELSREDKIQYIALCPNCAAEFDEWVRKNKNDDISKRIKNAILNTSYQGEDAVEIPFTIHGEQKTLRFTGKHFLDLQTILKQESQNTDIGENEQSEDNDNGVGNIENFVPHNDNIIPHTNFGVRENIDNTEEIYNLINKLKEIDPENNAIMKLLKNIDDSNVGNNEFDIKKDYSENIVEDLFHKNVGGRSKTDNILIYAFEYKKKKGVFPFEDKDEISRLRANWKKRVVSQRFESGILYRILKTLDMNKNGNFKTINEYKGYMQLNNTQLASCKVASRNL